MKFETARLYIRQLEPGDIPAFDELQGNINVMKYTTGKANSREENEAELKEIINSYETLSNDRWIMAVVRKSDDELVGTCAVIKNDGNEHEIGYRLLEKYWGNGYGKELLAGLVSFCLQEMGLNLITASVYSENKASVKMLDSSPLNFVAEVVNEESGHTERLFRLHKV